MRFLFVFLAYFSCIVICKAQQPVEITNPAKIYVIGKYTQVYEDKGNNLSIEEVMQKEFIQSEKDIPNFGMTHSTIWCRFVIENKTGEELFLEIGNPILDYIELYEVFEDTTYVERKAGILQAFSDRELQTNLFIFNLNDKASAKKQLFYLKLKNDFPLIFPLRVTTIKSLLERNHPLDVFEGAYLGIVCIMALYNLFIFISVRDKVYLWYVGYVVFSGILVSNVRGYAFEFLWPEWYIINDYASNFGNLVIICATFFTINFLNTKKYTPRWEKVLYVFLFFSIISILLNIAGMKLESEMLGQATAVLMFFSLIITGILVYLKGFKTARYYIFAWSFFLIGAIILIADLNGAFESSFFTSHAMQFGSTLEILLLSFALADRINTYKKEKEDAQISTLKAMKENEVLIVHQNKNLELKVEERTKQLKEANEEMHQINEELAVIIETVNVQKDEIAAKNKDITDSIHYAQRIQHTILPLHENIKKHISDFFVFFKPRDLVSGDFYYFEEKNGKIIFAAIDCTGHGVPGAFMTMIASEILNDIIQSKGITEADLIMNELHKRVRLALKQQETRNRDGMDMSLLVINKANNQIEFAGAHNPLVYVTNGQLFAIKGDRLSIGGEQRENERSFTKHTFEIPDNTTFYLFSDGLQDQFGGPQQRKFSVGQMRNLFLELQNENMAFQKETISTRFEEWMKEGGEKQIDDVLLIGFRI